MSSTRSRIQYAVADFVPIVAVVSIAMVLSVMAFLLVRGYYIGADSQQFERDTAYYSTSFKGDVVRHVNSMAAIRAFVSASHDVSRWEFSSFAHQILPQNSGFKAVLWLPHIGGPQRKAFEAGLERDGLYGLRLRELTEAGELVNAGARGAYLPVAYVEPFEASGSLIGVDLSDNPIYAPLFDAATRTGKVVVSAPVPRALVDGARAPIVLVVFPLSRPQNSGVTAAKAGAPRAPEGYALGVLQLDRVIEDAIGPRAPIQAAIAYGPATAPVVYTAGLKGQTENLAHWFGNAEFHQVEPFTVAGKHFFLTMRSARNGEVLTRVYVPLGSSLLILALTALLVQSMLTTIMRKRQVERAVIARTSELRQINEALGAEIAQRRQAEAQLRIAKDKAEAANRAKSAFLSTMSHELRTPLNAIIGFSSMLVDKAESFDARTADYLREINGSGVKLLDLINDILDITLIDTEENGTAAPVYLSDITNAVMDKLQGAADKAGVSLQCTLADPVAALAGDGKRLQKALLNLVSNAIKFTEPGGWAKIAVAAGPDGVTVEVSDNGVGMPPGAEAQITGLFSQFDSSLTRRHDGVGLGLTFVSRVAQSHDAELRISSTLGDGTRVTMIFPPHRIARLREVA
ncbi:MAG: CHASE domain-containing protein [Pseudomonadota bacterium]